MASPGVPMETEGGMSVGDELKGDIQQVREEIEKVEKKIGEVEKEIGRVEKEIGRVEKEIGQCEETIDDATDKEEKKELRKEKEQLRNKEEQLRKEKEQLRKEKEQLRNKEEQLRNKEEQLRAEERELRKRQQKEQERRGSEMPPPPPKRPRREPEVYRPPSLGVSPSYGVNQRSCWGKKRVEVPQFHHHFAVEARCAYERIKFEGDTIQVSIRGDSFEVNKQLLMEFITEFQVLSNLEKQKHGSISDGGYMSLSQGALLQKEQTKTALAVRAIDRFLFPNNELKLKGGCYHQLSSRVITSKPESPDVMVVGLNHDCCPTFPVLYGDWKNEQFEKAVVESCLYAITGMESQQKSIVFLGLPYAFSEIALKVYVGYEQKVLEMDICSCSVKREVDDEVKRFFCTLYGCVHSLIVSPIRSQYQSVDPFCCDGDHHVLSHRHMERRHLFSYFSQSSHGIHLPRVIHCVEENVVRKYYDSSFHRELNIDANVKYIPNATTEKLNDQVTVLKYPFLPGGHEPQSIEHIVSVIFKLNAIHSDGFVHSDIRKENLIFGPDNVSYIIDFDLTAKEEELYPPSYFSLGIQERHCDACASQKRFKNHDRWSLHKIIINAQMELTTYQEECIEELLNDTSLDNIAGRLRH